MIVLAVESSNSRGMGHLFRSLIFVKYFQDNAIEFIYLINNDKSSLDILDNKNIEYEIVDYNDNDSNWVDNIVKKYNVNIWINDKFETSLTLANHIKNAGVFLALVDDIGEGEIKADVNFVGLVSFSKNSFLSPNTRISMEYVVLNKEIDTFRRIRTQLRRIIVSFGGSDPYNNTIKVVNELLKHDYRFDVAIGPNYRYESELRELCNGRFKIYKGVSSMIQLLSNYDLGFTGGGVTCCEANASGLPCIIVANAPHEINTAMFLEKNGGCIYGGDYNKWDKTIVEKIPTLNLETMSLSGIKVFNTNAVSKIIQEIGELSGVVLI